MNLQKSAVKQTEREEIYREQKKQRETNEYREVQHHGMHEDVQVFDFFCSFLFCSQSNVIK